jgi:hypothetical protein
VGERDAAGVGESVAAVAGAGRVAAARRRRRGAGRVAGGAGVAARSVPVGGVGRRGSRRVGVTPSVWAGVLAGVVLVRGAGRCASRGPWRRGWAGARSRWTQVRVVLARHARAARRLVAPAAFASLTAVRRGCGVGDAPDALLTRYGFSSLWRGSLPGVAAELAERVQAPPAAEGEVVVFAIDAREGARAKLSEASLVPVRLSFFTDATRVGAQERGRTRVSEMKFARIERFAKQAQSPGCAADAARPGGAARHPRRRRAASPRCSIRTWWCRRGAACATSAAA